MRVRTFELRLLATILSILWATGAGAILLAYRPGGPIDLVVGLAACLTVPLPLAALVWPPTARGGHAFAGIVWLGLLSALLLVPSIGGVVNQLLARGPQTLLPSVEAAYPWVLALLATALFAGLGIARRVLGETAVRRDRLLWSLAFGVGVSVVIGAAFAGAALANDLALRDRPVAVSRFGPTSTDSEPPLCGGPIQPTPSAGLRIVLDGEVDRVTLGQAQVDGGRSGANVRWSARVETERALGLYGAARIGLLAWTLEPGRGWQAAALHTLEGLDLDAQVLRTALLPEQRVAAEELGLEYVEGARARHCRIALDGTTFLAAFPEIAWFGDAGADLHRWRGELDFWIFADGQLGRASGSVNGPASQLGLQGVLATIRATLIAVDRGRPVTILAPR